MQCTLWVMTQILIAKENSWWHKYWKPDKLESKQIDDGIDTIGVSAYYINLPSITLVVEYQFRVYKIRMIFN